MTGSRIALGLVFAGVLHSSGAGQTFVDWLQLSSAMQLDALFAPLLDRGPFCTGVGCELATYSIHLGLGLLSASLLVTLSSLALRRLKTIPRLPSYQGIAQGDRTSGPVFGRVAGWLRARPSVGVALLSAIVSTVIFTVSGALLIAIMFGVAVFFIALADPRFQAGAGE